ncbi:MAG: hypothetical protein Ct9H300mP12_12460 [Acidimicrobiales bacterium]|nr:MAG: hypothetical protein Ct9H300mP12_12460 [Acidimicrobiales bacterium]
MTITDPLVTESPVESGGTAFDQLIDSVRAEFDTQFTWDYGRGRDGLNRLYEKAKRSQWNVSDDLDWSTDVDPERMIRLQAEATGVPAGFPARSLLDVKGSPVASWNDDQWVDFAIHSQCASLSQFLHGEQGALLCTARLVEAVPWIEAKYYGSTQVVDEARHVEAFARYLDEKMPTTYPINENLKSLLDTVFHRRAVGPRLSGDAGSHRGAGAGRLRHDARDHPGTSAQADAPLCDGRRGPARGLRDPLASGDLRRPPCR